MIRCLSYLNSMSDIVLKKHRNFSSFNNVQYYCFQSASHMLLATIYFMIFVHWH